MQKILKTNGNIAEYVDLGKDNSFPERISERCPKCKRTMVFSKHGFYERYFISQVYRGYLIIRRYICQCKGATISLLPDFCLFRIAVAFVHILIFAFEAFNRNGSLRECLEILNKNNPNIEMSRQLLYFYKQRFMDNTSLIEEGLRQIDSKILLPDKNICKYKRAKELLRMVKVEFDRLESFTYTFFNTTNKSPLALIK